MKYRLIGILLVVIGGLAACAGNPSVGRDISQLQVLSVSDADFQVVLTADGAGLVITRFNSTPGTGNESFELTIPGTIQGKPVREIAQDAFAGDTCSQDNPRITSIVIPEEVTSIGRGAFSNLFSLTSVSLPEGLREIGAFAFFGCRELKNISIPGSVSTIGDYAFDGTGL